MSIRTILTILVIGSAAFLLQRLTYDPHDTKLPFGTTDLGTVQQALAKLPGDERALVEAYVARSRGDVLPAKLADPDEPLTARTFAEAIELQRAWEARKKVTDTRLAELRQQREARLAPLRAVVRASIAKAEIITRNEYQARINPHFYQQPYRVDSSPTFMTRIRVQNLGNEPIVELRGSLHASDSQAYLPMDLCWIDLGSDRTIPAGGILELYCGHEYRGASQQQRDFVEHPPGRFAVSWEPRYVRLASGQELQTDL